VANLLRTVGDLAPGNPASYRRVLSSAEWSGLALGCACARYGLTHLVPDGPVDLVGDDTVDGHPGPKGYGDEYQFTTNTARTADAVVGTYCGRWGIETTFQECRSGIGRETTRGRSRKTVCRAAPCLFGLYTVVAVLFHALPEGKRTGTVSWAGKEAVEQLGGGAVMPTIGPDGHREAKRKGGSELRRGMGIGHRRRPRGRTRVGREPGGGRHGGPGRDRIEERDAPICGVRIWWTAQAGGSPRDDRRARGGRSQGMSAPSSRTDGSRRREGRAELILQPFKGVQHSSIAGLHFRWAAFAAEVHCYFQRIAFHCKNGLVNNPLYVAVPVKLAGSGYVVDRDDVSSGWPVRILAGAGYRYALLFDFQCTSDRSTSTGYFHRREFPNPVELVGFGFLRHRCRSRDGGTDDAEQGSAEKVNGRFLAGVWLRLF